MKRVAILIDGQSLFHNLRNSGLSDKDINWDGFFKSILSKDEVLLKAYWFRPRELREQIYFTRKRVVTSLINTQYPERKEELLKLFNDRKLPSEIFKIAEGHYSDGLKWLQREKIKFSTVNYHYKKIEEKSRIIEIVRKGFLLVDPYRQSITRERGVEISIAVKALELIYENQCDKIIYWGGDRDLLPVFEIFAKKSISSSVIVLDDYILARRLPFPSAHFIHVPKSAIEQFLNDEIVIKANSEQKIKKNHRQELDKLVKEGEIEKAFEIVLELSNRSDKEVIGVIENMKEEYISIKEQMERNVVTEESFKKESSRISRFIIEIAQLIEQNLSV